MDMQIVNVENNSGDEEISNASSSHRQKKSYHRHTPQQIQALELFFKEYPHPDEHQRCELGKELGLDSRQIKFWFQNKRTQVKGQIERADNTALRAENEKIRCENTAIMEALKNVICPTCGGPPFGEEEREHSLHKLQMQNAQLREEHERLSHLLAKYIGRPIEGFVPTTTGNQNHNSSNGQHLVSGPIRAVSDVEKSYMAEIVANANEELFEILSSRDEEGINERKISRAPHRLKSPNSRIEFSKQEAIVMMNGLQMVDMLLDVVRWSNFFHTIVTKADTIHVINEGFPTTKSGSLVLMHEEMHILSPFVPSREFYVLRHCKQLEMGTWVVVDVSYDWQKLEREEDPKTTLAWKLPSGCMIHDLANGTSRVTWVEHVEVDDRTETHSLFKDMICSQMNPAYGAQRWVFTLQRMAEKFASSIIDNPPPTQDYGGGKGRKNLTKLSHRMMNSFGGVMSTLGKTDFPHASQMIDKDVRISVRKGSDAGEPTGIIVTAATSLFLPLPSHTLFNVFKDVKMRTKWDFFCDGKPLHEIATIKSGIQPGNNIKLLKPTATNQAEMMIIQESYIDKVVSMVIYAPIDITCLNMTIQGVDSNIIPILPSGFIISPSPRFNTSKIDEASTSSDELSSTPSSSILTLGFQILISNPRAPNNVIREATSTINTLICSTVDNIKLMLNCSNVA